MNTGSYRLIFKKMIYIDPEIENREIKNDRVRLKLIASQIIYESKRDKYLLTYNKFMILSVLVGISQVWASDGAMTERETDIRELANKTRKLVANEYASFYDGNKKWVDDYEKLFNKITDKLKKISIQNHSQIR
jgi:hypothetical protein